MRQMKKIFLIVWDSFSKESESEGGYGLAGIFFSARLFYSAFPKRRNYHSTSELTPLFRWTFLLFIYSASLFEIL